MKAARIGILGVAILAAGGAGLMAMKLFNKEPETKIVIDKGQQIAKEEVLVAVGNIPMGSKTSSDMFRWQTWPKDGLSPSFITKADKPDAVEELKGSIARGQIFASEPIREEKLVHADSGFMSAILPKGQRAVATEISTSTSAGGFILPNDRVDVLMTRKRKGEGETGYTTEIVLENVRVLAINQIIEDKEGSSSIVGETATLQLSPKEVEILAVAQETADRLSLSLRSLADSGGDSRSADDLLAGSTGKVRVIRYGNLRETDTVVTGTSQNSQSDK